MYRKVISAALSAALLLGAAGAVGMADSGGVQRGERVRVIVETEGAPLLRTRDAVLMGASEFMKTDEARETGSRLLSEQERVKALVEASVGGDADSGFTYTSVVNGFSMDAYEADLEKIRAVDGVKNVYIAPPVTMANEPSTEVRGEPGFGAQMMNAQALYDAGYDGRGQAIAIIDAGFDTAHEFFSSPVPEPRLSKDDIKNFIENNELNVKVAADQVYKSSKIPFAYDYSGKDADTFDSSNEHGNHIAGIAAGKNGVYQGTTFSGVAPQAQLILMKAIEAGGGVFFDTVIAAMDDASKMDICAVNLSLGTTYAELPMFEESVDVMRKAGIAVVVSAGNADRGIETAENPDYAYNNLPATYPASTAVASVNADKMWSVGGRIVLGSGEELLTKVYDEDFFKKFSDKTYDYVCATPQFDFQKDNVRGKVVVTDLNRGITSAEFLRHGAVGIIVISDDETDKEAITASDEIPGIFVRRSYGEKLRNAAEKTLKTDAAPIIEREEVPDAGMSEFTNWGTGTSLELKPEITAPGGNILSAVSNDKYEVRSGTSMASPQITGAIALLSGFVSDKFPDVKGSDRVTLIENLMMSSARIIFHDAEKTLPESPRRQGAGLADLKAAAEIPVILLGDGGKTKISLKDMLTDDITVAFTAKNLTDREVVYDDIKVYVLTDDYEETDGKNMVTDSKPLGFTLTAPESVTVPAKGESEIRLGIKLDGAQTAENKKIFTNGFWVDGFAVLGSKDGLTAKSSIPFTGFYGDWTGFDAMTPSYFEKDGSALNGGLFLRDPKDGTLTLLGTNKFISDPVAAIGYESGDYVGFSENIGDSYDLRMRMIRTLDDVTLITKDADGVILEEDKCENGLTRQGEEREYFDSIALMSPDLPEDDYLLTVKGYLAYDSDRSKAEEKTFKFYIDSTPPELKDPKIIEKDGKKIASFGASDNRYLMGAKASDAKGGYVAVPIKAEKSADISLDVTGMDEETLEFTIYDYAFNEKSFRIGVVSAEVAEMVKEGASAAVIADVTNTGPDTAADVVMALYSADGRLVGVQSKSVLLESGEDETLAFNFTGVKAASRAELFVWRHGGLTPVCESVVVTEL